MPYGWILAGVSGTVVKRRFSLSIYQISAWCGWVADDALLIFADQPLMLEGGTVS
jgi:hypothetical protein